MWDDQEDISVCDQAIASGAALLDRMQDVAVCIPGILH